MAKNTAVSKSETPKNNMLNKRMKKFSILFLTLCLGCFAEVSAQHMVTIKGKVKFADKDFKISVYSLKSKSI